MKRILATLLTLIAVAIGVRADTPAQFPGGEEAMNKFIAENLQYPPQAKENDIEGVVTVSFVVKSDGTIGTIKIARLIAPDLEQEAIRIVKKMPAWIPADKGGSPAESTAEISIPFQLPKD